MLRRLGIPMIVTLAILVTGCTRTTPSGDLDRSGLWGKIVGVVQDSLDYFYHLTHDYGIALLIVTLIVRLITLPLMVRQIRYQKVMQQLQPELKKIQAKYKGDKQQLQQEQMKLFQQYGANPLSGCFPIVIQMPILYALYGAINTSKALKSHEFLGILSLSATHSLDNIILAVIAAGTTFLQSKMTMTSTDPNAKMMMMIAPIMIAFFAYQYPVALGMYWAFSNILTMLQTYFTKGLRNAPMPPAKGGSSK